VGDAIEETMMAVIRLPELGEEVAAIVRRVHDTGESIDIEEHGVVVARITPIGTDRTESEVTPPLSDAERAEQRRLAMREWLRETEMLAQEIGRVWPSDVSAVEAVREQRREL
jgi:antitoxin (DNA-binding transcriptional repressor) of toxin-antitoxin stability system